MTAVEKYFFSALYYPRSAWSVIKWWECRRVFYNACVAAAGLVTLSSIALFGTLPPRAFWVPVPLWQLAIPVAVYGILANMCYTLGPLADLALRRFLGDRAPAVGTALFRYGFTFSIGLTLLPKPVAALGWLFRVIL